MAESNDWGKQAETIAKEYLRAEGYIVREENWRIGNTVEIDIIAQKDHEMVFVEVKARNGRWNPAVEAVDEKKIRKIVTGADSYLKRQPHLFSYRFDIIAITGNPENYKLDHYQDAFLPPLSGYR